MNITPIPIPSIISVGIVCIITLLVPISVLIMGIVKRRKGFPVKAFVFGVIGFFVSQIVIRLPIMQLLSGQEWYRSFISTLVGAVVIGGLTAGLFEETARLALGSLALKKPLLFKTAIAFGLGHGLCEVFFIVGTTYVNNLIICILMNSGNTDALAVLGVNTPMMLESLSSQLSEITPPVALLVLLERVGAVLFHVAATILVFRGIVTGGGFQWLWYITAILIHTVLNGTALILSAITVNSYVITTVVLLMSIAFFAISYKQKRRFPEERTFRWLK